MRGLPSILSLLTTSLINVIIQEHDFRFYLSHDIKIAWICIFAV